MTPRLWHIVLYALLALGLAFGLTIGIANVAQKISGKAETQSHVDSGKAQVHADAGMASDAKVKDAEAVVVSLKANLDRVSSERDALLRRLKKQTSSSPVALPSLPDEPSNPVDVRDAVIAKDAEVIESQKSVITQQETVIKGLTISRDQWKDAYNQEKRALTGLQIALDAQKVVSSSNKWLYRAQGLVIGLGAGYATGRLK